MISQALMVILDTAYLFGVLCIHENIRFDQKVAIGTQAASLGILHGGQRNRVPSLDEIGSGRISDIGILRSREGRRTVEENFPENAPNVFIGFARERASRFGVCSASVRQKSVHQPCPPVPRRSLAEYERQSGKNLEAGRRNIVNGKANKLSSYGDKNKQVVNVSASRKVRSIERHGDKNKGRGYVEDSWKEFVVTSYSHGCTRPESGVERPPQKAANGKWPVDNWTVAADKKIPFDTVLELSYNGIVTTRIVGDRGGAIKGNRLDLFMSDCERARMFGVKRVWVRELSRPLGSM